MSQILNLIPDTFRRRNMVRRAIWRWGGACIAVAVAGLACCAPAWWELRSLRARVDHAEGECRGVRLLLADADRLKKRLRTAEQRTTRYDFARETHLPLSMIGIVSREVRALKGRLKIDDFDFRQVNSPASNSETQWRRRVNVVLSGYSRDDSAISQLVDALRRTGHFAEVELKSTSRVGGTKSDGRRFQLHCLLFIRSKQEQTPT